MSDNASREFATTVVEQEAQRGEFGVSVVRAALQTAVTLASTVIAPTDPLLQTLPVSMPAVMAGCAVLAWGLVALARPGVYRPYVSVLSMCVDIAFLIGLSSLIAFFGGGIGATALSLASTPVFPMMFFIVVASGARQRPLLSLLGGFAILASNLVLMAVVAPRVDPALVGGLRQGVSMSLWFVRSLILGFTTVLVAFGAHTARRMAERAGALAADHAAVVSMFGRYVDPNVAAAVMSSPAGAAETRDVTVVFTDLRGFTTLSEAVSGAELLALLNAHYAAIVPAVHKHGGTVNKFVGDSVMAVFGAPIPHADHAARALLAGVDMLAAMDALNVQLAAKGSPTLAMGVGVASGSVIVGRLGADDRVEYAVIGDTVNTAARLEGLNKEHGTQLLASAATVRAAGNVVPMVAIGQVEVRGKTERVAVYTLKAAGAPA